jgi:hypothetical protein
MYAYKGIHGNTVYDLTSSRVGTMNYKFLSLVTYMTWDVLQT